jgi:hypothetical protein
MRPQLPHGIIAEGLGDLRAQKSAMHQMRPSRRIASGAIASLPRNTVPAVSGRTSAASLTLLRRVPCGGIAALP